MEEIIESKKTNDVVKSISKNQHQIIRDIIKLHIPSGVIDCDPTYSTGKFYEPKHGIDRPKYVFDIQPQLPYVVQANCSNLPLENESINSLMFDPPFVISKGPSLELVENEKQNMTHKRFSSFENPKELFQTYEGAINEAYRLLKDKGVLIFKCQDTVSGGKQYFTHCWIMNKAYEVGFYPKDLFILEGKSRIISGKHKNQQHARKFHSYFWVFTKEKSKVIY